MLLECKTLQSAANAGMIKDFRDLFREIIPDIDEIVREKQRSMEEKSLWRVDQLYTKPFSVLITIAEELERIETNKLSVKYLSDKLRLGRKTILLISSLLEKLGL